MAAETVVDFPAPFQPLFQPHRYKVYYGGRGSGKSMSFARALLILGATRPLTVLCTREIQTSINDSVHRLLREQADALGLGGFYTVTKSAIYGQNGTEFTFKGLRFNSREIKSTEGVDICWVEEGQAVSADSWDVLIPTIRKPGSEIWISFNPLDETDPTFQRFVVNPPESALVRKVNYDENPYFPDVLANEMEWLKKRDYQSYLHIWEGEVRKHSNALVFAGYFSVEDFETPRDARFYQGADWGFAADPTTLIRCFIRDRKLYIDREAWGIGVEIDKTPALFDTIETARLYPIKADCARPETISYMKRQGFRISAAKKWQGSIEDGIEFLKTFDIVIHPRCKHTIDEFNHYSYKVDKQTNDILPTIVDANNHCLIGSTLVMCADGEKPIKDIRAGEYVYTRQGLRKVLWSGQTAECVQVYSVVAGSYVVTGTADHRLYTSNRGWVPIGEIQEGDMLLCVQKQSRHTAKRGTDIQSLRSVLTGNTSSVEQYGFTGTHGSRSAGKSLLGWLFTIKTGIVKTITSITLNVLHRHSTDTDTHSQGKGWNVKENIWLRFARWLLTGTKAKQGASGTRNTPRLPILGITTASLENANNVEKNLLPPWRITASAPIPAKAHGEGRQELTTKKEPAQYAGKSSKLANIQGVCAVLNPVQCVNAGRIEKAVYDLTVEGEHEFFANGVLVHNCMDALRYAMDGLIKGRGGVKVSSKAIMMAGRNYR